MYDLQCMYDELNWEDGILTGRLVLVEERTIPFGLYPQIS
jgi:hypothetical protein